MVCLRQNMKIDATKEGAAVVAAGVDAQFANQTELNPDTLLLYTVGVEKRTRVSAARLHRRIGLAAQYEAVCAA